MPTRFVALTIALIAALVICSPLTLAQQIVRQPGAVYDGDKPGETFGPAPRRDFSGTWEPAKGAGDAIQANGAKAMPSDGKPEHELPYTPAGRAAFLANKPTFGTTMVPSAFSNDPMPGCDPQGFPRVHLHNFRTMQIVQTAHQVLILYEFNKKWRVIWTDRDMPKTFEEPRWWGYSVGRWVDDYTLVAQSAGFDDRTWLDNAGRPHSDALRVEERYHRVDSDHVELTITVDDPTYYTRPWVALDKLPLRLQPRSLEIHEMECAPSETAKYNRLFGNPAAGVEAK